MTMSSGGNSNHHVKAHSRTGLDQSSDLPSQSHHLETPTFLGNVSVKFPQSIACLSSEHVFPFGEDSIVSQGSVPSPNQQREFRRHNRAHGRQKSGNEGSNFRSGNRSIKMQVESNETVPITEEEDLDFSAIQQPGDDDIEKQKISFGAAATS